jgi:hypothetical protein
VLKIQDDPNHQPSMLGLALVYSQLTKLELAKEYLAMIENIEEQSSVKLLPKLRLKMYDSVVPKISKDVLRKT